MRMLVKRGGGCDGGGGKGAHNHHCLVKDLTINVYIYELWCIFIYRFLCLICQFEKQ